MKHFLIFLLIALSTWQNVLACSSKRDPTGRSCLREVVEVFELGKSQMIEQKLPLNSEVKECIFKEMDMSWEYYRRTHDPCLNQDLELMRIVVTPLSEEENLYLSMVRNEYLRQKSYWKWWMLNNLGLNLFTNPLHQN